MIELIFAALATYGISALLVEKDGFMDVFLKLREIKWLPFSCITCTAVWVGVPITLLSGIGLLGYFATLGIIVLIERIV